MSWLRFFLILLIPLICHAWLWKRKSKSSPASSRTPRYTSSSRTPTHSWTARKPSIRRPSIRRPSRPACSTKSSCESCTSHRSWSGSCRWCPDDGGCHAAGAVFTNPCRRSENIVNKWNCYRARKTTPRPKTPKPPTTSTPKQRCKTMTTCVSCTSHKSWSGSSCRWCPKDERCHAYGAILTNPCRRSQNIVNKWNCNRAPKTTPRPTTPKPPTTSTPMQRCKTMTTCVSCTSHKSWSGSSCRWCPKDEKCHAYGAIFTNPCRRSQNIVNKESCSNSSSGTLTPKTSKPSTSRKRCITKTNCTSCTSHKSWSGSSCSWCPKDGKCHAHGAIWTNPCRTFQNIVNKDSCSLKLPSRRPPRTQCITKTNCTSCTSHKSWSGRPCRWCPKDGKCHAHGAIWTNPCTQSQNIVKKESCPILTSVELCINKERCFPPPCRIMTNCSSCTSHKSSSGRPCRWCPEDNKCHNYTAIFTNPCRIRQNIVNKERCYSPRCRMMTNCTSCTSLKSSAGFPCHWCPKNNKCHGYDPANLCKGSENIVNKERCPKQTCTTKTNITSCKSHKSSSGFPCRWCPRNNKCYANDAVFANSSLIFQNIVKKENCSSPSNQTQTCAEKTNCTSCTSHMSSSGFLCRWCPEDNKCYAHDAAFTNSCSIFQNININGSCPFPFSYDRNLSYNMVVLSALAYADNVSNYIAKAAKVDTFRVVKQISNPCRSSKCPGLTNCSGFIAVSEKEKAIAIVFRGAQSRCQALYGHGPSVPLSVLSEYVLDKYNPVQTYFSDQFQKIWNDMKLDVYSQIDKHPSYELWVTGHCLGGALASLASTHIAVERKTPKNKLILYTFGQPRVGNYNYSLAHDMLVPISFRVVHYGDPVVHVPNCNSKVQPGTLSRCQAGLGPYHHGKEIFYNKMFNNSSYKTCDGLPRNEDVTCSNKLFAPRIEDQLNNLELYHYKYFGFDVRRYM